MIKVTKKQHLHHLFYVQVSQLSENSERHEPKYFFRHINVAYFSKWLSENPTLEDSFELEPERVRQFQEQESKQDDLTQISGRFESDKSIWISSNRSIIITWIITKCWTLIDDLSDFSEFMTTLLEILEHLITPTKLSGNASVVLAILRLKKHLANLENLSEFGNRVTKFLKKV